MREFLLANGARVIDVFRAMDINDDGEVSQAEFAHALKVRCRRWNVTRRYKDELSQMERHATGVTDGTRANEGDGGDGGGLCGECHG